MDEFVEALARRISAQIRADLMKVQQTSIERALLGMPDAARYLGRTKCAMQHLVAAGDVPYIKIGRRVFFDKRDLDAWINAKRHAAI